MIFRAGELLVGVLDKSQFGASELGLVHAIFELYGPQYAADMLSCLSRLFTQFLQLRGFTCSVHDLVIQANYDKDRRKQLKKVDAEVAAACAEFAEVAWPGKGDAKPDAAAWTELRSGIQKKLRTEKASGAALDAVAKRVTSATTSSVIGKILPNGQGRPFPVNNFAMMTVSGAKGSQVNFSQIACLLGQQELEGRRVASMASGKTLPSFLPFDTRARANGYVADRFLTGVRPQEYFFHCMGGREGLVDTAVKTSRSGYLQRCLVKHLESLVVAYDRTVRDCDGSIVQFHYGDDSLDVIRTSALKAFDFLAENPDALIRAYDVEAAERALKVEDVAAYNKKVQKTAKRLGISQKDARATMLPMLDSIDPVHNQGCVSEKYDDAVAEFISSGSDAIDKFGGDNFQQLMQLRYHKCLVDPGESVGLLAAQSVGEPSTQMTLYYL